MWVFRICFCLAAGLMAALPAHAEIKSAWAFYDIKLSELVRVAMSQLLQQSFVADDALIRDERRVSLDLKQEHAGRAGPILIDLLLDAGYKVTEQNGLWKIRKTTDKESDSETLIYRPKFRSASYFYDVLGIGKNRGIANHGANASSAPGVSSAIGGTSGNKGAPGGGAEFSASALEGGASQYIDRGADVVYLKGTGREIENYTRLLESLDRPADQVDISVVVYEYTTTESEGRALGAIASLASGKFAAQFGAVEAIGDFLRFDNGKLQLLLSMVDQDKRFHLLSSPNVRVKSGEGARIGVGATVPTLSSTTQGNGTVTQSVSYQPTGIILDVQPSVFENVIDLKVRQSVSEAIATSTGVNNSPTLTTRDLSTNITLQDGEAVVLGGLTSKRTTSSRSGLPFLPTWLHSKGSDDDRTELVIFLRVAKPKRPT